MADDDPVGGTDFWEHRYYVSPHAVIVGDVTFGGGCVVLAGARIIARAGRIRFGAFCLVEEYAEVVFDREAAVAFEERSSHEKVGEEGGVEAPGRAPCYLEPPQHEPTAEMLIGPYNHVKAYAALRNVAHVGSGNCLESFSCVKGSDREPCLDRSETSEWVLGDLCVVAPYVVVNVSEFSKITECGLAGSAPASDFAQHDARFLEKRMGPSRVTFLPRTMLMDEIQETLSPKPEGVRYRTEGFSVVPRHGTRSSAEFAFIAQTMMKPHRVGDASGSESRDTFVAHPPNPQLAAETLAENDAPNSEGGVRLIKEVLDGYTTVWEQAEIESLRKLCKYYLITYGWMTSSKQRWGGEGKPGSE